MRGKKARELRRSVTDPEAIKNEDGTLNRQGSRMLLFHKEYVLMDNLNRDKQATGKKRVVNLNEYRKQYRERKNEL